MQYCAYLYIWNSHRQTRFCYKHILFGHTFKQSAQPQMTLRAKPSKPTSVLRDVIGGSTPGVGFILMVSLIHSFCMKAWLALFNCKRLIQDLQNMQSMESHIILSNMYSIHKRRVKEGRHSWIYYPWSDIAQSEMILHNRNLMTVHSYS